jgi:hemerythrin-like metal-binding protein
LFKVDTRKDANDAGKVIDELITYTHHHFNTEEAYLDSINYAEIEKQINEHKYFITILGELTKENIRNDKLLRKQLIVHLSHWIYHHILEEDKKYSIQQ